jgi:peptidyl-tRNA hydrolase
VAKKVDITEKLELCGNPYLIIAGHELEVNADAATMLTIMDKYGNSNGQTVKDVLDVYKIIFPDETRKMIDEMKLSFIDLKVIIEEGMNLITGNDKEEDQGEALTPATT